MTEPTTRTLHGDAPLAAAKHPDPRASTEGRAEKRDALIERTVTINRPRQELYAFW